jgi:hypothetical protein
LKKGRPEFSVGQLRQMPEEMSVPHIHISKQCRR